MSKVHSRNTYKASGTFYLPEKVGGQRETKTAKHLLSKFHQEKKDFQTSDAIDDDEPVRPSPPWYTDTFLAVGCHLFLDEREPLWL